MKIEELAYTIKDLKKVTIAKPNIYQQFTLDCEMGYIKNLAATPVRYAVKRVLDWESHNEWGVTASDSYLPIEPKEVIGPVVLNKFYIAAETDASDILFILQEVR